MYKLFDPQIKVQKNRDILRITDMRMAKYSRRGLISNFLVYLLCLLMGSLHWYSKPLAILLTAGLLIITLTRAYFLFRFETIYPRGPAKWRNVYFIITLIGAMWWGFIMASFTLTMGLEGVVPLMWLYTVVFFSTTAHAFAPYNRFLTVYQFLGVVPAAFCVFFVGEAIAIIYGLVLIIFCAVLNHQSQLVSAAYWDKHEAEYELKKQTEFLEEEKRDTQKSAALGKEYMGLLKNELHSLLTARRGDNREGDRRESDSKDKNGAEKSLKTQRRPKLELLYRNVSDFQSILTKEVEFENGLFNIRNLIQGAIARNIELLEGHQVDIASLISPSVPVRVFGDAERMNQVVSIILRLISTQSLPNTYVFVDVEFTRDKESGGQLVVNFERQLSKQKISLFKETQQPIEQSLDLALAKAIIEQMGGKLEFGSGSKHSIGCLRFQVAFDIPNNSGQADYQKVEFRHKKILLIHPEPRVAEGKQHELEALGFEVDIEKNYKNAMHLLEDELKAEHPVDAVMFYANNYDDHCLEFSSQLLQHPELKFSPQVIIGSNEIWQQEAWQEIIQNPVVTKINKPTGYLEFEMALKYVFSLTEEQERDIRKHQHITTETQLLIYGREKNPLLKEQLKHLPFKVQTTQEEKRFIEAFENEQDTMLLLCADKGGLYVDMIAKLREQSTGACIYPVIVLGTAEQSELAYCKGADYFFDLELPNHYLKHIIEHWLDFYRLNASV